MNYDPAPNELGEQESRIDPSNRGLPDQFQGRYNHKIRAKFPENFFPLRSIKSNAALDTAFEAFCNANPGIEQMLIALGQQQLDAQAKRGNFKLVWNAARTKLFGQYAERKQAQEAVTIR